jgi:hypothetical protein
MRIHFVNNDNMEAQVAVPACLLLDGLLIITWCCAYYTNRADYSVFRPALFSPPCLSLRLIPVGELGSIRIASSSYYCRVSCSLNFVAGTAFPIIPLTSYVPSFGPVPYYVCRAGRKNTRKQHKTLIFVDLLARLMLDVGC